jgi:hypothetical protein
MLNLDIHVQFHAYLIYFPIPRLPYLFSHKHKFTKCLCGKKVSGSKNGRECTRIFNHPTDSADLYKNSADIFQQ